MNLETVLQPPKRSLPCVAGASGLVHGRRGRSLPG